MGKFYVVGLGPGRFDEITPRAVEALKSCDVIAGYGKYIDLIRDYFPDKEFLENGMTGELKRCQMALAEAVKGKTVAMVSSGDSGVYGMAGLILELVTKDKLDVEVEILSGISALASGGALLGSPLMHDFAVISLSDRLTPWELIAKRLEKASEADFSVVLYNPKSKGRPNNIDIARDIMMKHKSPDTPCGIVKNIGRKDEEVILATLSTMPFDRIDMFSTVFIGNSQTYIKDNKMITPRGYLAKAGISNE